MKGCLIITFQTAPREIVHYMCQQSLINYLYSELNKGVSYQDLDDNRLEMFGNSVTNGQMGMKIEHPPVEEISKDDIAFLIQHGERLREQEEAVIVKGKETKDYFHQLPESIRNNAVVIDEKLASIKVCDPAVGSGAFPVGMMNEIVKARHVLETFVNSGKTIYEFKRGCIENSLYGVDIDAGAVEIAKLRLWLSLVVDEDDPQNIKPLPNLDYKVVCGNSLVGFPENWGSPIEKEIETLIHQHLNETNPKKKEYLKKQIDEKIESRYKISLKAFGYQVNFDFRTLFSEVFQQNGGFDVVIANPPYIDSERMVSEGHLELRKTISRTYKLTKGNWDIYIAFFEKGFNILNSKGTLTYITPDKWISKPFGDVLRINKIANIAAIMRAGREVFEDAKVDAIVTLFSVIPQDHIYVYLYDNGIVLKEKTPKIDLSSPYNLDALFSSGLELIQKIGNADFKVADNFICENACATSDAYKLKPLIQENKENTVSSSYFKIVNTGTIGKYISKWEPRSMVYLGDEYFRPIVKRDEFFKNFKNAYAQKTLRPKIIMKGLNLLDACLDNDGSTIPGKTTLIVTHKNDNLNEIKFLLALINSTLIFYYIRESYSASSYNKGVTFTKAMINSIPIPHVDNKDRKTLIAIVELIIATKRANPQVDTSNWEEQIDQLVYKLYGLTEDEIKIVEGKNSSTIQ